VTDIQSVGGTLSIYVSDDLTITESNTMLRTGGTRGGVVAVLF